MPTTLNVKKGDIVLVKNDCIGIVRYIGFINTLSNGVRDDYVGIEIKHQKKNAILEGKKTNGTYFGYKYFTTTKDKGLFVSLKNVQKQYSPEDLFDYIDNVDAMFDVDITRKRSAKKRKKQPQPQPQPVKPTPTPKPKPPPVIVSSGDTDLDALYLRLSSILSSDELDALKQYVILEEFAYPSIVDDLDTFEDGDSCIVEYLMEEFEWDMDKQKTFIEMARNINYKPPQPQTQPQPQTDNADNTDNANIISTNDINTDADADADADTKHNDVDNKSIKYTPGWPDIRDFIIPKSIIKKKDDRSIRDIEICFRENHLPADQIILFRTFCKTNNYKFNDLELNMSQISSKLRTTNSSLTIFLSYISKCIWELSPPLFLAGKFDRKDENQKFEYFEYQCRGIIKHDRDLLQYFLLTENTQKALPSELVDIADRIYIEEKKEINIKKFAQKYFFKNCNKKQISIIANGLQKYHTRFFPRWPKVPIKYIADKISGYQKYSILLSQIIESITSSITVNNDIKPFMIDMMIIPPGCYNKFINNSKKSYDASGPMSIGYIADRLKESKVNYHETRGLTDKPNNFDDIQRDRIIKKIIDFIKKLTNNYTKLKQKRICIVIDRRWRVNCSKFDAFTKLKATKGAKMVIGDDDSSSNDDDDDDDDDDDLDDGCDDSDNDNDNDNYATEGQITKKYAAAAHAKKKSSGSWFGGIFIGKKHSMSSNSNSMVTSTAGNYSNNFFDKFTFYENKHDTIYVYQPTVKTPSKNAKYHEFNDQYCHETLLYLTKECIIPRKNHISRTHFGGDTADGWLFNISVHVEIPKHPSWYKYDMRWYIFLQSSALRFFREDMTKLWSKYFVDTDEDTDKMTMDQINDLFMFNLRECDSNYKRWYHAIKRSD